MAIQSNQPSVNWVLVSSRCPWSRLVKSREIVHPGEREAWGGGGKGLFCDVPWWAILKKFWELFCFSFFFLRGVGPKNGELFDTGKNACKQVENCSLWSKVLCPVVWCVSYLCVCCFLNIFTVCIAALWGEMSILYCTKMPLFVFTVIYIKIQ